MAPIHPNRRNWWNIFKVEEELQKGQVLQILACLSFYVAVSTVILCVFFVYFSDPQLESGGHNFWTTAGVIVSTWGDRPDLHRLAVSWIISMTGLSTIFAAAMGTYFSQKVAGPVYRLKKDLGQIVATGKARNLTLRDGDAHQDLADAINQAFCAVGENSTAESGTTSQIAKEIRKHLASFEHEGMCEPDAQRVEAWLEELRRLVHHTAPRADFTA
jgi:hypothetical protein